MTKEFIKSLSDKLIDLAELFKANLDQFTSKDLDIIDYFVYQVNVFQKAIAEPVKKDYILSGSLLIQNRYDFIENEQFTLEILGQKTHLGIDTFKQDFIDAMSLFHNLPESDLLYFDHRINLETDLLEFYFVYQTEKTWMDNQEIKLIGAKSWTFGYTNFNKVYIRGTWQKPNPEIYNRQLTGFAIPYNTNIETQTAIYNNLLKITSLGELADIRAFTSAFWGGLRDHFQKLKWKTILLPGNKRLTLQANGSYK